MKFAPVHVVARLSQTDGQILQRTYAWSTQMNSRLAVSSFDMKSWVLSHVPIFHITQP